MIWQRHEIESDGVLVELAKEPIRRMGGCPRRHIGGPVGPFAASTTLEVAEVHLLPGRVVLDDIAEYRMLVLQSKALPNVRPGPVRSRGAFAKEVQAVLPIGGVVGLTFGPSCIVELLAGNPVPSGAGIRSVRLPAAEPRAQEVARNLARPPESRIAGDEAIDEQVLGLRCDRRQIATGSARVYICGVPEDAPGDSYGLVKVAVAALADGPLHLRGILNSVADADLAPEPGAISGLHIPVVDAVGLKSKASLGGLRGCAGRLPVDKVAAAGVGWRDPDRVLVFGDVGFGVGRRPGRVKLRRVSGDVPVIGDNRRGRWRQVEPVLHQEPVREAAGVLRPVVPCARPPGVHHQVVFGAVVVVRLLIPPACELPRFIRHPGPAARWLWRARKLVSADEYLRQAERVELREIGVDPLPLRKGCHRAEIPLPALVLPCFGKRLRIVPSTSERHELVVVTVGRIQNGQTNLDAVARADCSPGAAERLASHVEVVRLPGRQAQPLLHDVRRDPRALPGERVSAAGIGRRCADCILPLHHRTRVGGAPVCMKLSSVAREEPIVGNRRSRGRRRVDGERTLSRGGVNVTQRVLRLHPERVLPFGQASQTRGGRRIEGAPLSAVQLPGIRQTLTRRDVVRPGKRERRARVCLAGAFGWPDGDLRFGRGNVGVVLDHIPLAGAIHWYPCA